jgi:hypothetical protein
MTLNWKGYGRKRSWPNLRCYPGICLERLRKTTKNLQSGQPIFGPWFEPGTCWMRSSSGNYLIVTFGWTVLGLHYCYLQHEGRLKIKGNFVLARSDASRPALGPTQPPIQWVPGVLSPGVKRGRGMMLTTHPHLVPRLRMSKSYTSSPPNCLHGV